MQRDRLKQRTNLVPIQGLVYQSAMKSGMGQGSRRPHRKQEVRFLVPQNRLTKNRLPRHKSVTSLRKPIYRDFPSVRKSLFADSR